MSQLAGATPILMVPRKEGCPGCYGNFGYCRLAGNAEYETAKSFSSVKGFQAADYVKQYIIGNLATELVVAVQKSLSNPTSDDPSSKTYTNYAMLATHPDRLQRMMSVGKGECMQIKLAGQIYDYLGNSLRQPHLIHTETVPRLLD